MRHAANAIMPTSKCESPRCLRTRLDAKAPPSIMPLECQLSAAHPGPWRAHSSHVLLSSPLHTVRRLGLGRAVRRSRPRAAGGQPRRFWRPDLYRRMRRNGWIMVPEEALDFIDIDGNKAEDPRVATVEVEEPVTEEVKIETDAVQDIEAKEEKEEGRGEEKEEKKAVKPKRTRKAKTDKK